MALYLQSKEVEHNWPLIDSAEEFATSSQKMLLSLMNFFVNQSVTQHTRASEES